MVHRPSSGCSNTASQKLRASFIVSVPSGKNRELMPAWHSVNASWLEFTSFRRCGVGHCPTHEQEITFTTQALMIRGIQRESSLGCHWFQRVFICWVEQKLRGAMGLRWRRRWERGARKCKNNSYELSVAWPKHPNLLACFLVTGNMRLVLSPGPRKKKAVPTEESSPWMMDDFFGCMSLLASVKEVPRGIWESPVSLHW